MQTHSGNQDEKSDLSVQVEEFTPPHIIQVDLIHKYLDQKIDQLDYDEICEVGREARNLRDFSNIVIGRLALNLERRYGEATISSFAKEIQMDPNTVSQYRWVASKFPQIQSYNGLSYSYFRIAAGTQEPQEWVQKAIDNGWNVTQFQKKVKGEKLANECSHTKTTTVQIVRCEECGVTLQHETIS